MWTDSKQGLQKDNLTQSPHIPEWTKRKQNEYDKTKKRDILLNASILRNMISFVTQKKTLGIFKRIPKEFLWYDKSCKKKKKKPDIKSL